MHQLLLSVKFFGTAIPVAIGFIDSLRLRFPILFLQIFPHIKHPQQGVLGVQSQVSTHRHDSLCSLLLGVARRKSVDLLGGRGFPRPGEYLGAYGGWAGDVTFGSLLWVFGCQRTTQAPLQL